MLEVLPVVDVHITSPYGMRDLDGDGEFTLHAGTDFRAPVGTPLYAMGPGLVHDSGQGAGGRDGGLAVDLDLDGEGRLVYLHMSRVDVQPGEHVAAGQLIGLSGATGVVSGPHLHLQWQPHWPASGATADIEPLLSSLPAPGAGGGGWLLAAAGVVGGFLFFRG